MRIVTRSLPLLALALGATLAGCMAGDFQLATGPRAGTIGTSGDGTLAPALVGVWDRSIVFESGGQLLGSQTTWTFRSDGSATRVVIARNYTLGLTDVTSATATWQVTGDIITIAYLSPPGGTVTFRVAVSGGVLTLDGVSFTRIG